MDQQITETNSVHPKKEAPFSQKSKTHNKIYQKLQQIPTRGNLFPPFLPKSRTEFDGDEGLI